MGLMRSRNLRHLNPFSALVLTPKHMKILVLRLTIAWVLLSTGCKQETGTAASARVQILPVTGADPALMNHQRTPFVLIPAGQYQPFFGRQNTRISVPSFAIDETPVTNQQFLRFVLRHPEWQRGQIVALRADDGYLRSWASPTETGSHAPHDAPVTEVSWFAAKAYCTAVGGRLPTVDEWEFVATQDQRSGNPSHAAQDQQGWLNWFSAPTPAVWPAVRQQKPNTRGVYDLRGLVWEWVYDFNTAMTTGESRKGAQIDTGLYCSGGAQGSSNLKDYPAFMRFAYRGSLKARYTVRNLGFRCVYDLPKESL